jgi:preprotein translocase subunit SecE
MDKLIQYLKDVRSELIKVTWPTREELTGATWLVILLSMIMAIYVFICDKIIFYLLRLFL